MSTTHTAHVASVESLDMWAAHLETVPTVRVQLNGYVAARAKGNVELAARCHETLTNLASEYLAYAEHRDDTMPSADEIAEMLDWAEEASDYRHSDTYAAYDRLARNAGQLLDRAYEHRSVGYALSAIERATRASELAAQLTEFERAEMRNLIGEAQRFIQRVKISAQYAR
ncbi:hypothetical protein SEA_ACQUIRE49_131 [Mycobacterium phage Acquire49]|nr:hypothetical protein SEA_ACQUIRE49_131 [Mycobacterium phage Acquire49]